MSASIEQVSTNRTFEGELRKYKFKSTALGGTDANFNVFVPNSASAQSKAPVLFYLAGLTCNEDTGAIKGSFLKEASDQGIAIVFPDTSPRGANIEGEDADWDFGSGAGFYLNATSDKYKSHYHMKTHIASELPSIIEAGGLPLDFTRQSVFGHSMGGHGALTLYLSNLKQYRSGSALAPIANPVNAPWGKKAFGGYLAGGLEEAKADYDATELISKIKEPVHILVDYGTADQFYKAGQLLPEHFVKAARAAGHDESEVSVRSQEGYDHSYWFIATFAAEHIQYHAKYLKA